MEKKAGIIIKLYLHGLPLTNHGGNFLPGQSIHSPQSGIKYINAKDLFIENYRLQLAA
jgi:hypothetical protein